MPTKKLRKFKVVNGIHVQEDRTYRKGETVETDQDLNAMFANKFVEVGSEKPDPNAEIDPSEDKVIIDGARSGKSTASTSRSSTTTSAGPVAQDWAVSERAGKGSEVEEGEGMPDEDADEDDSEETEKTDGTKPKSRTRKSK